MSDQSDSQNLSEQQVQMSEGTSPSSSSDDGSRSTPSNLPKAATRQRKKRTSDSEDEDYVAEEEATSMRVEPAQGIKPGMKIKRPAGRQPMSKARMSTEKPIEPVAAESKKRKERVKKTVARVLGKASIMEEEEEEEVAAPAPKAPKLMGDAIKSGGAASKAKPAPKPKPKRNTRSIPAAEKKEEKGPSA